MNQDNNDEDDDNIIEMTYQEFFEFSDQLEMLLYFLESNRIRRGVLMKEYFIYNLAKEDYPIFEIKEYFEDMLIRYSRWQELLKNLRKESEEGNQSNE